MTRLRSSFLVLALAVAPGLAVSADSGTVYAALNGTNKLGVIDAATGTLTDSIPVGNAPQGIAIIGDQAFVTNRGGRPATSGDNVDSSDGTNIVTNPGTETPASGTVSVVNLGTKTQTSTIKVGIEPTNIISCSSVVQSDAYGNTCTKLLMSARVSSSFCVGSGSHCATMPPA